MFSIITNLLPVVTKGYQCCFGSSELNITAYYVSINHIYIFLNPLILMPISIQLTRYKITFE